MVFTGMLPTSYAWLPHSLYIGCASGHLIIVDTAAALKSRHQAQHAQHTQRAGQAGPGMDADTVTGVTEGVSSLATARQAGWPVAAMLEYGGHMAQVEALAVNKDCVAVAGHCPVIRWALQILLVTTTSVSRSWAALMLACVCVSLQNGSVYICKGPDLTQL